MTDIKITISLTHEQVFVLTHKAKQAGLDLKTYLRRFVEIPGVEIPELDESEE